MSRHNKRLACPLPVLGCQQTAALPAMKRVRLEFSVISGLCLFVISD